MSNELAKLKGGQLSADIMAKLQQFTEQERERIGSTGGGDLISINGKKSLFIMPNEQEVEEFEALIIDFAYRNEYYIGAYNPKEITPPACFAIAANATDLKPSDNAPVKQNQTDCATCQQNQFGTSATGSGKACKNTVLLAVLPPDPKVVEDHDIWIMKTSPTAIRHFNRYATKVSEMDMPLGVVRTRIYFDPSLDYASVRFEAMGTIENAGAVVEKIMARKEEAARRLMEEPDVSQFEMPAAHK